MSEGDVSSPAEKRIWPGWQTLRSMDCARLEAYLKDYWPGLAGQDRADVLWIMAHKGCQNAVPFLLRQLESDNSRVRCWGFSGLSMLGRREYRGLFIKHHMEDPDPDVRSRALWSLSVLFARHQDTEILRLALTAFDDPQSSLEKIGSRRMWAS